MSILNANESLKQIDDQLGSNPGGKFWNPETNEHFYIKFPKSREQIQVELLASKLQTLMGIRNFDPEEIELNGKFGIITKWKEGEFGLNHKNVHELNMEQMNDVGKIFVHAVLTRNWDAVGIELNDDYGNIRIHDKRIHGIDPGGSFHFRARGGMKPNGYPEDISELQTLRNPEINKESANIFNIVFDKNPNALLIGLESVKNLDMDAVEDAFRTSGLQYWKGLLETFKKRREKFLES